MTAQSIVCGACAAEVPYGRLSCPSCGELLASVAGSRRSAGSVAASVPASAATADVAHEPSATPTSGIADGELPLETSTGDAVNGSSSNGSAATHAAAGTVEATVDHGDTETSTLLDDDPDGLPAWSPPQATVPWGTASDLNGGRTPAYMPRPGMRSPAAAATVPAVSDAPVAEDEPAWPTDEWEPQRATEPPAARLSDPDLVDPEPAAAARHVAELGAAPVAEPDIDVLFPPPPSIVQQPDPAPAVPAAEVSWPDPRSVSWPTRESVEWPAPAAAGFTAAQLASADDTLPTGAVDERRTAPARSAPPIEPFAGPGAYLPPAPVTVPSGPPAPAREWAGHAGEADGGTTDAAGASRPLIEGDMRTRLLEFVKWLSVAGAAFAAVGFLLPWGQVVIGSADTGYFGRWGIAGPWHLLIALAILADLGLALIDNKVPVWIRTGVAGLGLGALLVGLVWPYLTLPALGAGPGAVIAGIGATGLVVSGIIALVADRHAEAPGPV